MDSLLQWERSGKKWQMFQQVLPIIKTFCNEADSTNVVFGGDMNTLSHLDWTVATKGEHNGLIVPW